MENFNSFSRQRALALVSYLQRYNYLVVLTLYSVDEADVAIYFDSAKEMHDLKNFLNVFLIDAFSIEEKNLSDHTVNCYILMVRFK